MEWTNDLLLGNDPMDDEHKEIIRLINKVLKYQDDYNRQGNNFNFFLSTLTNKISQHFVDEEHLLELGGCPISKLIEHTNDHMRILLPLLKIRLIPNEETLKQIISHLSEELDYHMATIDIECAPYLAN